MNKDCSTCICKEGSCYPSVTIFDKDKTCKNYAPDYEGYITDLEEENAELKADNDARKFAMAMSEKVEKQLREEIAELKDEIENDRDLPTIAYMQGAEKQKKKDEEQFIKAKKLLKKVVSNFHNMDCVSVHIDKTIAEAEQFLKDSEVEK